MTIECVFSQTDYVSQLKNMTELFKSERTLRRREAQGEIFHEDGKVLICCTRCREVMLCSIQFPYLFIITFLTPPQYVEDPAAHVAEVHTARGMSKRGVPCPLGCGTVFTPK